MSTFRTLSRRFPIVLLALFAVSQATAQHLTWQKPVERDLTNTTGSWTATSTIFCLTSRASP